MNYQERAIRAVKRINGFTEHVLNVPSLLYKSESEMRETTEKLESFANALSSLSHPLKEAERDLYGKGTPKTLDELRYQ